MMQPINNINGTAIRAANVAEQTRRTKQNGTPVAQTQSADRVDISRGGERLANFEIARSEQVARVERIRSEIAQGTYETEHRIDRTVDRIFGELAALDLHA